MRVLSGRLESGHYRWNCTARKSIDNGVPSAYQIRARTYVFHLPESALLHAEEKSIVKRAGFYYPFIRTRYLSVRSVRRLLLFISKYHHFMY